MWKEALTAYEGPQAGGLQGAARGCGGSFTAVGIAPPFLSFLRRQRPSQTLQWGPLTLVGTASAPPGRFSVLQPSPLTEEAGFRRGDESRPRQLSTPVTGWQPITGPSPGVARSEVRPQSGVCAGSLNPRGMTCWACFSTSGVNDLASGVAGSWIFISMKLFTALFLPSHHWAELNSVLSLPLMESVETGVGNLPLIL